MAKFSLRCVLCEQKFPWEPTLGYPEACPICGRSLPHDDRPDSAVVRPAVISLKTRVTDKVYRDIERGSQERAEIAAQVTNSSVDEMKSLVISNLRDSQREGEMAAIGAEDAQRRIEANTRAPVGHTGNASGFSDGVASGAVSINGQVYTGIEPNAGARAVAEVQSRMSGLKP